MVIACDHCLAFSTRDGMEKNPEIEIRVDRWAQLGGSQHGEPDGGRVVRGI